MLFGTNDMADVKIVIIDHRGEVVKATTICPSDHMVLFTSPGERHIATD